jgi:hypothetical protein
MTHVATTNLSHCAEIEMLTCEVKLWVDAEALVA